MLFLEKIAIDSLHLETSKQHSGKNIRKAKFQRTTRTDGAKYAQIREVHQVHGPLLAISSLAYKQKQNLTQGSKARGLMTTVYYATMRAHSTAGCLFS